MSNLNNLGININSDPSQAGSYDYRPLWRIARPDYAINLAGDCINCETGQFLTLNKGKWFILFDKITKTQTRYRQELLVGIAWCDVNDDLTRRSPFYSKICECAEFFTAFDNNKIKPTKHMNFRDVYLLAAENGDIWDPSTFSKRTPTENQNGYIQIYTAHKHVEYAHRLVAEAWIPVPQRYLDAGYTMDTLEVNHIDGNTHNNAVSNLEWVTRLGNAKHAYENNLHRRSHDDEDLETIWKLLSEGKTDKEISELTSVPSPTISSIRHKRSPRYITDKYTWPENPAKEYPHDDAVIADYNAGMTMEMIALRNGLKITELPSILRRNRHRCTRQKADLHGTKVSHDTLIRIFEALHAGKSDLEIAREFRENPEKIANIRSRRRFTEEGAEYSWPQDTTKWFISQNDAMLRLLKRRGNENYNATKFKEAYEKGIRHERGLANALGIKRHEVIKYSKKLGLPLVSVKAASLDDDTLNTIFNYLQEGKSNREIANLVNIDIQRVNNIRIRQRYVDKSVGYTWPENDTAC